jgi:chromosome segregation ATPase
MNEQLNRELNKIDENIRQAVIDADEFLFNKLNRARDENLSKQFFQTTKNLQAEIQTLSESRQTALAVREDLQAELKLQADLVFEARSRAFDEQEKHNKIQFQLGYLDNKIANDRETIRALQNKLDSHVQSKLSGETTNDN